MHVIKAFILLSALSVESILLYGQVVSTPGIATDTTSIKIDSLKPAIVKGKLLPKRRGDTIEYNTGNIRLRVNANVEELLTMLPGLHILADGSIIYNGEKIQRLLVDGEDIFGSDPTLVTRNFDGSKIARVQVIEQKSDKSLFTGVDDGTRIKTLNLVLRDDAKDGYFGKIEVGTNTVGDYNANSILAAFRKREQFTALGLASSTGSTGFSGSAGETVSSINFLNGNSDALGASAGSGIPHFEAAALHYANSWDEANHLMVNYQFSHYNTQPITITQSVQDQPNGILDQMQKGSSNNEQVQNWLYGRYDNNLGSRSRLRINYYGSFSNSENQYSAISSGSLDQQLVNNSERNIQDKVVNQNIGGSIDWNIHVGRRTGQIFAINAGVGKVDATTNGYLYSLDQFYSGGGPPESADTVNQRKSIGNHNVSPSGAVSYTQPLWKGALLGMSYGVRYSIANCFQATFDQGNGKYDYLVDSLSSQYKEQTVNQQALLNLQGNSGRLTYTIGNEWRGYSYKQVSASDASVFRTHNIIWAPLFILNYNFSTSFGIVFKYDVSVQQPSSTQLVSIINNTDPLHIVIGNPGLKPGVNKNFRIEIYRAKDWVVNVEANLSLIGESISSKTITDSLGRQISQPVNVNGGNASGFNLSVNRKIGNIDFGFHSANTFSRTVNFVNTAVSKNNNYALGGGVTVGFHLLDKCLIQLNSDLTYSGQVSSINSSSSFHYWAQTHSGTISWLLPGGLELNSSAVYSWQQKSSSFAGNSSVLLWNNYISRNFVSNRLCIRFQVDNLLNANAGVSRTSSANINTQTMTNILGRYWMLSATWHFDRKFKKK